MKNWYIVQAHSSFENKVAQLIKEEAEKAKLTEKIEEIVIPTHDVTEVKRGKRIFKKGKNTGNNKEIFRSRSIPY